jgi:hypothetical protein
MPLGHVAHGLKQRYARVLGDIERLESELAKAREMCGHLEAVMAVVDAGWQPDAVPSRKSVARTAWPRHGVGVRTALEVLRMAGTPPTALEIVEVACPLLGMPEPDKDAARRLAAPIMTSLAKRVGRGVEVIEGRPRRWRAGRQAVGLYLESDIPYLFTKLM